MISNQETELMFILTGQGICRIMLCFKKFSLVVSMFLSIIQLKVKGDSQAFNIQQVETPFLVLNMKSEDL